MKGNWRELMSKPEENDIQRLVRALDEGGYDGTRMRTEAKYGAWICTNCGSIERSEREVYCWPCGQGQMVFFRNVNDYLKRKQNG